MDHPSDQEIVERAFGQLGPFDGQLLLWHRIDGLSYEEIATKLGISHEAVIRRMSRMMARWSRAVEVAGGLPFAATLRRSAPQS